MQPTLERQARRKPGRALIGPKAQAHVPQEIYDEIEKEALARNCSLSDVWREVILDHGFPSWAAQRGAE